ncbi:MAG: 3-hydroxyisobutyrate dehydrogenase [Alphaproteobacteria bacterium]|nr:3-hydroxyisobutyrate dehydrogenase [Alphaproteobacteria bacterium]
MSKITFIGLGNMGLPMAANLVKAGHAVCGFDLDTAPRDRFLAKGGRTAPNLREAVQGAEVVISMLPEGRHVRAAFEGPDGVFGLLPKGTLVIDCSTIDVDTARGVAGRAAEAGLPMLDAPVSGGVGGAEAGTLTFMVGGAAAALERARPLLEAMGKRIVHCGGAGNGEAAKICNNLILAISMIGVSEAFALARRMGLPDQTLFDVASTSSGQCWSLTSYCPVPGPVPAAPSNRGYAPGFAASMMLKDVRLALAAAGEGGLPLGRLAERLYTAMHEAGHGGRDFSGIFEELRQEL